MAEGLNGWLVIPVQQVCLGFLAQEVGIIRMLLQAFLDCGLSFEQHARTAHLRLLLPSLHSDRAISPAGNTQLYGALLCVGLGKKALGRSRSLASKDDQEDGECDSHDHDS